MSPFKSRLLAIALAIGGGVFSPAILFSAEYQFMASYFDEPRASLFSMDEAGSISLLNSYAVGRDAEKIAASPNGQLVVVSSGFHPQLTALFVHKDGSTGDPQSYDWLESNGYDPPVAFHPIRPLGYAAFFRTDIEFTIDYATEQLAATSCTLKLDNGDSPALYYSTWSEHLYYRYLNGPCGIRGTAVNSEGCLTSPTGLLEIPRNNVSSSGFAVSPNGRWAAAIGATNPEMSIARIYRDGSLELHQQFSYTTQQLYQTERIHFTHDGRYLILLTGGPDDLISYRYNPGTNLWVEAAHAQLPGAGIDLSITPDDRYLVWIQNYPGFGKDGYYYTTLQTIQINDDGSFTYLPGKSLVVKGYMATLEFIPPWSESYPDAPNGVMMH